MCCGDGVAVVMIVEEPAVEAGVAQRGLNRLEVHTTILRGGLACRVARNHTARDSAGSIQCQQPRAYSAASASAWLGTGPHTW